MTNMKEHSREFCYADPTFQDGKRLDFDICFGNLPLLCGPPELSGNFFLALKLYFLFSSETLFDTVVAV